MTIGERIKAKRKEKNLTQNELGSECGMSGVQISKYESGAKKPKLVSLKRIAIALQTSIHYFLDVESEDFSILEKLTGASLKQLQVYADTLDMSVPQFVTMGINQSIEFAKAYALNKEPKILNKSLAEANALDKAAYGDNPQDKHNDSLEQKYPASNEADALKNNSPYTVVSV